MDDAGSMESREEDELLVVRKMLELGYQVELDAVGQLLAQEGGAEPVLRILESVARSGAKQRGRQFVITMKDVKQFLKPEVSKREEEITPACEVVFDPTGSINPTQDTSGYVQLFRSRLSKMSAIIRTRPDFFQIEKLNAIKTPSSGKKVVAKVVGLVVLKKVSGEYTSLTLEDDSGYLRLMCTGDAVRKVDEVLVDEFVLAEVESLPRGYYARNVHHPDVPERAKQTCKQKVFALFVSDLHIGSPDFDRDAFVKMIDWVNGDLGELDVVTRIAYLVLNGDLVENPLDREGRLNERGIEDYYDELAGYLGKIRSNVEILVVPGETDATRFALPQPAIVRRYARRLYEMKNVVMLGNPSLVRLHGVAVLLYHGQSLDEVFRQLRSTSVSKPTTGMRALLRARHTAPTYGGLTLLAPEREDWMIIDPIPDVMHCGHSGFPDEDVYRGILLVSTPSWVRSSGLSPRQGRAALVDLSTFEVLWRA